MSDKPMLFSAPMVKALLEGRKTQTRRIIKPRPYNRAGDCVDISIAKSASYIRGHDGKMYFQFEHPRGGPLTGYSSRINVGDQIWGRESWRAPSQFDRTKPRNIPESAIVSYEADDGGIRLSGKLRTSMHMPRWASRLTLIVESVKVERLQAISEDDAIAEGVDFDSDYANLCVNIEGAGYANDLPKGSAAIAIYQRLWEDINGAGSWDENPWVMAVSFSVIRSNIDALPDPLPASGRPSTKEM